MTYELHHGDCLEVMRDIPDGSIDCVITDPPYGTTACKWDSVIPFEPMWKELKRIAKPKAAICLFGSQPFTSTLIASNLNGFRYEVVWDKVNRYTGFLDAKRKPLKRHENIAVFASERSAYYPQMGQGEPYKARRTGSPASVYAKHLPTDGESDGSRYPFSILPIVADTKSEAFHPTQKPVDLIRYLVRTYTLENETVLDFTMGSGTTGVACVLEGRRFIGIEKDEHYFKIAQSRIEAAVMQPSLI